MTLTDDQRREAKRLATKYHIPIHAYHDGEKIRLVWDGHEIPKGWELIETVKP